MELSSEISTPEFENLEAASYETILKQIKVQRSTINLLHLQLKKQGTAAVDEILEEKDRIILSLEQQMKQGTLPESTNSTQELEKENDKLSQDLASLRSRGREVEIKYNDHLNELQDKINLLKSKNPGSSVQGASSTLQGGADLELARQEIETLEGELRLSRQQEEFYRNQVDRHRERIHNGEENSDSLSLSTEIEDLRRKLEERDKVILDLRESAMTQDPASSDEKILVDNECLRNKIDILEKEIERQNEKALRVDSKSCGPTLELLNSVLDSYQEARSLSKADGASASLGVLAILFSIWHVSLNWNPLMH